MSRYNIDLLYDYIVIKENIIIKIISINKIFFLVYKFYKR